MAADDILINSLDLSRRAHNCLRAAKFKTVGDLLRSSKWELANIRGFGKHSMEEVAAKVAEAGFVLPRDVDHEKIDAQAQLAEAPDYLLTKREYFAAMAMQGIIACVRTAALNPSYEDVAVHALAQADALIAELNR